MIDIPSVVTALCAVALVAKAYRRPKLAGISKPLRDDIVQVMKHTDDGWVAHSWVAEHSEAAGKAWDTPGFAVKRGESIDYGIQR